MDAETRRVTMGRPNRRPSAIAAIAAVAIAVAALGASIAVPPRAAAVAVALVARPDSLTMSHDRVATVPAPGVLANDVVILDTTAQLSSPPGHGTVDLAPNGGYQYIPDAGFVGSDSFKYFDTGIIPSNKATVSIRVTNAKPAAVEDAYSAKTGVELVVPAPGVLKNDSDGDGDSLKASLVNDSGNGSVSLSSDGSFTFKSGGSFVGPRTFTYRVTDGIEWSATVKVTIDVGSVTPTPTPTPAPTPTPTPLPTIPLPTIPLPSLPLPTVLPTRTPTPTRSPDESATPTPDSSAEVSPTPGPTQSPGPSDAPTATNGPGSSGGSGGTVDPGRPGSVGIGGTGPGSGDGRPPIDGSLTVGRDRSTPIDGLADVDVVGMNGLVEWAVPSLVLGVPGLLLILAVVAQALVGTIWLPVVRRWLGASGIRRRRTTSSARR